MYRRLIYGIGILSLNCSALFGQEVDDTYVSKVKPVLIKHCSKCHGPLKQQAGLRVDSAKGLLTGGDSGAGIVPGESGKSLIVHAITRSEGVSKMPPEGPALSPDEIAIIRSWIDLGAKSPRDEVVEDAIQKANDHWAFQPVKKFDAPSVIQTEVMRNPVDSFIVARLHRDKIAMSPEADRATLLRRVTLDLLGIAPSREELHDFLNDKSADAFDRLVDRLLASPHFGERWGRDWLDVARYADSNGFTRDMPRTIWKYRDWVIEALNRNQPFDEFVIDQLAGDMLPSARLDQIVATGFHRNTLINEEGGTDPEQFRIEAVVDRVNTTGTVFLGLTVGCCQCHDHKYDPLSQREYYQLFAFFNNAAFNGGDPTAPRIDVPSQEQLRRGELDRQKAIRAEIARLESELQSAADVIASDQAAWEKTLTDEDKKKLPFNVKNAVDLPPRDRSETHKRDLNAYFRTQAVAREKYSQLDQIAKLREQEPQFPSTMVMQELEQPRESYIHLRGDFLRRGARVEAAFPAVLSREARGKSGHKNVNGAAQHENERPSQVVGQNKRLTRLELAKWLTSGDNPLTARVTVNRIWQKYFGRGLVETENDFGTQGTPPTHPELLDWLASEFAGEGVFDRSEGVVSSTKDLISQKDDLNQGASARESRPSQIPQSRWDLKRFHRLLVTSATYRQSSHHRMDLDEVDPVNRLLARQSRLRLDAEVIRDSALRSSGVLTEEIGGAPVYPPQPDGVFDFTQDKKPWNTATGTDRYRKAMYTQLWRSSLYPAMTVFDFPDANVACTRRVRSNTPLQSLTLANDLTFIEFARGLAARILALPMSDDSQRVVAAYELCLARTPSSAELARLRVYLEEQKERFARSPEMADEFAGKELRSGATPQEAAAWTAVSRVIMNLDEFITRE